MERLKTINQLKKSMEWAKLSSTAKLLFYELVILHAHYGSPLEFICSNQQLCNELKIHESTLIRCRNKLIRAGFILFQSNLSKREAGVYSFNTTCNLPVTTCKKQANNILYIYNNINTNLEKENNKKKENILPGSLQAEIEQQKEDKKIFAEFLRCYPGAKRTVDTEYEYLQRKHADYRQILPLLLPAVEKLIKWTKTRIRQGLFVPDYPSLHTWINQRRWETELPKNMNYD